MPKTELQRVMMLVDELSSDEKLALIEYLAKKIRYATEEASPPICY